MEGFDSSTPPSCGSRPYGPVCDIALNLLDEMFQGIYNDKKKHEADVAAVLQRAKSVGCERCIVTCGCVEEAVKSVDLISSLRSSVELYMTVGVHPTRCGVFTTEPEDTVSELSRLIEEGMQTGCVVAIGECGLDYDRLHFCDADAQKIGFRMQLDLADRYGLPLFLHDRNTAGEFLTEIESNFSKVRGGGVVHSFTGTLEEMEAYTRRGLYIGINGCSLKTEDNIKVVAKIPLNLLLLETDAPWCGIKNTHASKPFVTTNFATKKKEQYTDGVLVKDRCEPCHIINVLEVVAALHGIEPEVLSAQVHRNTNALFFRTKEDP